MTSYQPFNLGRAFELANVIRQDRMLADQEGRANSLRELFANARGGMPSIEEVSAIDPEYGQKMRQYQALNDQRQAEVEANKTTAMTGALQSFKAQATDILAEANRKAQQGTPEWENALREGYQLRLPVMVRLGQSMGLPVDPSKPLDINALVSMAGQTPEQLEQQKMRNTAEQAAMVKQAVLPIEQQLLQQKHDYDKQLQDEKIKRDEDLSKIRNDAKYDAAYQTMLDKSTMAARTEAEKDIPAAMSALEKHNQLSNIINESVKQIVTTDDKGMMKLNPKYSNILGWGKWSPARIKENMPGGLVDEFKSIIGQLTSSAFLNAYSDFLKGGGPITEVEGTKATLALTALQNYDKLSPDEIVRQINNFIESNNNIRKSLEERAGGSVVRKFDELHGINTGLRNQPQAQPQAQKLTQDEVNSIIQKIKNKELSQRQLYDIYRQHPEIVEYIKDL